FYMEAEAQIGAGVCGASAVFFLDQLISSVFQGTPEIVQIKISGIGFRILAEKQLHGFGSMLKIKVGADQVCMRRQIRIKFVIEKGMMVKVMLIYGEEIQMHIYTSRLQGEIGAAVCQIKDFQARVLLFYKPFIH